MIQAKVYFSDKRNKWEKLDTLSTGVFNKNGHVQNCLDANKWGCYISSESFFFFFGTV